MTKIKDAIEIHEKVETMRNMLAELDLASVENKIELENMKELRTAILTKLNDYYHICSHDILIEENKKEDNTSDFVCPICGVELKGYSEERMQHLFNVFVPSEESLKRFGEQRDIELNMIARMSRFTFRNSEATVDDFFEVINEEYPAKCKRKLWR